METSTAVGDDTGAGASATKEKPPESFMLIYRKEKMKALLAQRKAMEKEETSFRKELHEGLAAISFGGCLFVFVGCVGWQAISVPLMLDGILQWSWTMALLPTWIGCSLAVFAFIMGMIFVQFRVGPFRRMLPPVYALLSGLVAIALVAAFAIMVAQTLDLALVRSWSVVFSPIYVLESILFIAAAFVVFQIPKARTRLLGFVTLGLFASGIVFSFLHSFKLDGGFVDVSWTVLMIPNYVLAGAPVIYAGAILCAKAKQALPFVLVSTVLLWPIVSSEIMIVMKLEGRAFYSYLIAFTPGLALVFLCCLGFFSGLVYSLVSILLSLRKSALSVRSKRLHAHV